MKSRMIVLTAVCGSALFIPSAEAQMPTFFGPGLFTRGAGDIGTRSGDTADFRLFAGVSAIYDNGLQPLSVDSSGHLSTANGLYGEEAIVGVYGQRPLKHGKIGLDYHGTFRHYNSNTYFDGSDHQLAFGYSVQHSQRLSFDVRQVAGSASLGADFAGGLPASTNPIVTPTSLLFDNRTLYLQSTVDASYIESARNTITVGGGWSLIQQQSSALIGVRSYDLHGSIEHQHSLTTTFGVTYQHSHYDFPQGFGESDINLFLGFLTHTFGRNWKFVLHGGVYQSEVIGLQQVALDPILAELLGINNITEGFYRSNILPSADISMTRNFRKSYLTMSYGRSITPGNGVYLTARQELAGFTYAFTGVHKWSFSLVGNYGRLDSLGQDLQPYSLYSGGVAATYAITRAIYATAHFDERHYTIADSNDFRRTASRITFGLTFSPAEIPLSFR